MSSFSALLHETLVNIFQYLPFRDRIRMGMIDQKFRQASIDSIDHTEVLEVSDDLLQYCLTSKLFFTLLESCSPTLRSIKVNSTTTNPILLRYLPEMAFPNLTDLEFSTAEPHRNRHLIDLVRRNRANLRSIVIELCGKFVFCPSNDHDFRLENLRRLTIRVVSSSHIWFNFISFFQSIVGRTPNLKYLKIQTISDDMLATGQYFPPTADASFDLRQMDALWPTVPNLCELQLIVCDISDISYRLLYQCHEFWKQPSLRSLKFDVMCSSDKSYFDLSTALIKRIADSFPNLERFASKSACTFSAAMELSRLRGLRELRLDQISFNRYGFVAISTTFASLTYLQLHSIGGVNTTTDLINILTTIAHLGRRKLAVRFVDEAFRHIWDSDLVRMVLEQIKTDRGVEIEFLV